ncbi:hypothetical protein M2G37_21155 [Vibrio vulnificus]|nr:hypothetical protein [Vibrio vulnificus]
MVLVVKVVCGRLV